MKIKSGYLLRTIADTHIVVPIAERVIEFKGMMTLNEVAASIWEFMKSEDRDYEYNEILEFILSEFEIDKETAERDLKNLLEQMETNGVIVK